MNTLLDRFDAPGPKRMLALDGGGIRGAVTMGFLEALEANLRKRHNKPHLLLCDYFDLIGGTSTGAIIATLLATGRTVTEIKEMYKTLGGKIFGKKFGILDLKSKIKADYDAQPLIEEMNRIFGNMTLGSDALKTGVCIITKRADTFSTWPFINHPRAKYYNPREQGQLGNKDLLLKDVVRASTAAPTYFLPQLIQLGDQQAAFVDGGVSMYNNPALQMFLVATLQGFPFHWETGADKLLLVSVGTGSFTRKKDPSIVSGNNLIDWAKNVPDMLMEDAAWQSQLLLQYLSNSPTRMTIDREVGNMQNDLLHNRAAMHYVRYQAWLEQPQKRADGSYEDKPHLPFSAEELVRLHAMDAADQVENHLKVGEISALHYVKDEHIPPVFDLPGSTSVVS
jgi:uncharacterized protein